MMMKKSGAKFFKGIFVIINVCIMTGYLMVSLVPYINTGVYWPIALPGLIFPLLAGHFPTQNGVGYLLQSF